MQTSGLVPPPQIRPVFLTAKWTSLVMINYAVDPTLLAPFVPRGVELDDWNGAVLVSMVGFRFLRTRVLGLPIPFHQNFEEVNLRFYVRRRVADGWRRGVVFIREIVPRQMVAVVARVVYDEPYLGLPMRQRVPADGAGGEFEYGWRFRGEWCSLGAETVGEAANFKPGGAEEFIFEHYWGYTRRRNGKTAEYEVEHVPWRVWQTSRSWLTGDMTALYGPGFGRALQGKPVSAFVAEGSDVLVRKGSSL